MDDLIERGVLLDHLADGVGRDYSAFDLVCHVANEQNQITLMQRANRLRKRT